MRQIPVFMGLDAKVFGSFCVFLGFYTVCSAGAARKRVAEARKRSAFVCLFGEHKFLSGWWDEGDCGWGLKGWYGIDGMGR